MKAAPFEYHAPSDLAQAVELLQSLGDDARVLAGGQSLVPMLALRLAQFDHLMDLSRVPELTVVERTRVGVRIGAMVTQARTLEEPVVSDVAPLLVRATPLVGHFQIRNRGTVGGSLAHADPAAEYPAVAVALDAEIELRGPRGTRRVSGADFFVSTWTTVAEPDEILVAVHLPSWEGMSGFSVREAARRHGDFAMAGVACAVEATDGRIVRAAIGLFGMGSRPIRASGVEGLLCGTDVKDLDLREVGWAAVDGLAPPSDIHASGAQRRRMGAALVRDALTEALQEVRHA